MNARITAVDGDILVNGELVKAGDSTTVGYLPTPICSIVITRPDYPRLDDLGFPER